MHAQSPAPLPHLGLVCITHTTAIRYQTMTLSRYKYLPERERPPALQRLYDNNLAVLLRALDYCAQIGIRLYRVTSALFPLSDLPDGLGETILESMTARLAEVGRKAKALGIRVVIHPDQYVVLSSDFAPVVDNSVAALEHHARIFDWFGLERSPWASINIHGGKGGKADQLIQVIGSLPPAVSSRLCLENDERAYGAEAILEVCRRAGVPMVFDAHHHLVKERLPDYEDPSIARYVALARETWPVPDWQIVHLSNGRKGLHDHAHHDLVTEAPSSFLDVPWIEIEAKTKEVAIAHLRERWLGDAEQPVANG